MRLTSPGFRSQLIFTNFDGASYDRGDHVALHSLTNPTFFWGNLLIFERPPAEGDYERWMQQFETEFTNPAIYHRTFAWQSKELGDITQFTAKGFKLESTAVLTATRDRIKKPGRHNSSLEIRTLNNDQDWNNLLDLEPSTVSDHLPRAEWKQFIRNQERRYRAMEAAGRGHWHGGFIEGKLVTALGLFHEHKLARFQSVATHANHQRQGFCQTLVYEVSKQALESGQADSLVMCADPDYHAIQIYESVGFHREALEHGVSWFDPARAGRT